MTKHHNRDKIVQLSLIKPSAALQHIIDIELSHQSSGAVDLDHFKQFLKEPLKHTAVLGFNGTRYHVSAMQVMLDEKLHLLPQFKLPILEDAVAQAVRKQFPERRKVQVDLSWSASSDEEEYDDYSASVWWDSRRQYEQFFCYIRY